MLSSEVGIQSTKRNKIYSHYDVIIIGAGIAGLVCGAFLARSGKKVLVVEQHFIPGGYCTSFKRKGFNFDAAVHHIGGCGKWSIVGRCFKTLGIEMDFYHLDPMDNLIFPSFNIEIPADFDKYKDQTYAEMLNSFFGNEELKMVLSGQWGYIGLPPTQASAVGMCQMMINYLKDGAFFPAGGTQEFTNAIFKKFIDFGGHVMLSSEAKEILLDNKSVKGVKLHDGKEIHASTVVSNIDAYQTFFCLLDGNIDATFLEKIGKMKESFSFSLLYLGLGEEPDLSKLIRGFYHTSIDTDDMDKEWMYISVPTKIYPGLAPKNKQIISVVVYFKDELYNNISNWNSFKEEMTTRTISRLESYVPNIKNYIEVKEAATPKTLERYTLNKNGAAYGWAVSVNQIWENRLPQKTPINNLYLTGHWTRPGPGICAVVSSGWGVSNLIMENWR